MSVCQKPGCNEDAGALVWINATGYCRLHRSVYSNVEDIESLPVDGAPTAEDAEEIITLLYVQSLFTERQEEYLMSPRSPFGPEFMMSPVITEEYAMSPRTPFGPDFMMSPVITA